MSMQFKTWKTGLLILAAHLGLIGLVAAKSAYDHATLPRVWARVQSIDKDAREAGEGARYLHLHVCPATWPAGSSYNFPVRLRAVNGSLLAEAGDATDRVYLTRTGPQDVCLAEPLQFFLEEGKPTPGGPDLWVELLLPPNEVPRPIRLRKGPV